MRLGAGIAQHGDKQLDAGDKQRQSPHAQHHFQLMARSLHKPAIEYGHEQIKPYEHIQVPQRSGVEIKVEDKGVEFDTGCLRRKSIGRERRIRTVRLNIIQIDKKQNRQGDRPKDQRNDDPADPFPVEIGHTPLHGQQQDARHHNEQRHARTDQTSGERPGQKRGPILIELGNDLPSINTAHRDEQHLIEGCQSRVWVDAELRDGRVYYSADSDAIITKGIIALLIRVLNGRTPQEILDTDLYFIDRIGLRANLSPTRSNGLVAMIKQMRLYALAFAEEQKHNLA